MFFLLGQCRTRWDARPPDCVKRVPQSLQEYDFSPVCQHVSLHGTRLVELHSTNWTFIRLFSSVYQISCLINKESCTKRFPHVLQAKNFSKECVLWCLSRCALSLGHASQSKCLLTHRADYLHDRLFQPIIRVVCSKPDCITLSITGHPWCFINTVCHKIC